jgi:plastocyanin
VEVGGTFQLTATPLDTQGNTMLSGAPTPAWETSDAARATVSQTGLVTGVAAGPVAIRAIVTAGSTVDTSTATLTVVAPAAPPPAAPAFASLTVSPEVGTVAVGGALQLTATPRNAAGAALTGLPAPAFTSSDATRATVDAGGLVRGVAAGAVTIRATLTAGGVTRETTASITVTASAAPPSAPTSATVQGVDDAFSPSAVTIAAGGTVTWTMVDEEHDVTWTGAAPAGGNTGRIDRDAPVSRTFASAGTYTYLCNRHDGDHGGTVTVVAGGGGGGGGGTPVFTSLTLTPASPAVQVGGTVQLTATPRDQLGAPMAGLPAATFTTSDASRATVSATGLVTAVAAGAATITAQVTAGGVTRQATASVTVTTTAPPPATTPEPTTVTVTTPGVTFSPRSVTIPAGGRVSWQFSGDRHNVTFTGAAPTGGNIPDTDGATVTRTFPTVGTYNYSCTRHNGMTGTVVVQ